MINIKIFFFYKIMLVWIVQFILKVFLEKYNIKEGIWVKLIILSGFLVFYQLFFDGEEILWYIFDVSSDIFFVDL